MVDPGKPSFSLEQTDSPVAPPRIRCRQIADSDIEEIATLLKRGFGIRRSRRFWLRVLQRLQTRRALADLPRYGYLVEREATPVGVILQIFSTMQTGGASRTRCNVSSWYVEPAFRSVAPLLVSQALKHKDVTYLNISSAPHTRPMLEAQGYTRYSNGVFVAFAGMGPAPAPAERIRIVQADSNLDALCDPYERDLWRSMRNTAASAFGARAPHAPIPSSSDRVSSNAW